VLGGWLALLSLLALTALGWAAVAYRYFRVVKYTPRLDGSSPPGWKPLVSVILPARNEEPYVAQALESLLHQTYPRLKVLALDDGSSDATPKIMAAYAARSERVYFHRLEPTPRGWAGKAWACHRGYQHSRGELLLFTDADAVLHPDTVSASVAHLAAAGVDALTLIPRIRTEGWLTSWVQPALNTIMLSTFSPVEVNDPHSQTAYCWGAFILVKRSAYEAVGGHHRIRADIVEDRALGRIIKHGGFRLRMAYGVGWVSALWARSTKGLWSNLERIFYASFTENPRSGASYLTALGLLTLPPLLGFPTLLAPTLTGPPSALHLSALILLAVGVGLMLLPACYEARLQGNGWYKGLGTPIALLILIAVMSITLLKVFRGGSISWKGRKYPP
jgi:cellulose synthase/poly-beta-1,6-N-acetylglucosamine synthase-like glycosyltransferase